MKKVLAAVLCAMLMLALLPMRTAQAATATTVLIAGQEIIGGGYWKNNAAKTGIEAGTSADWNAYYANGTLYLKGLTVTSSAVSDSPSSITRLEGDISYAIHTEGGDLTIHLSGSNIINTNDNAVHTRATLYFTGGSLTVEGDGSLTAYAQNAAGNCDSHGVYTRNSNMEYCPLIVKGNARLIGVGGEVTNDPSMTNTSCGVYVDGTIHVLEHGSIHGTGGKALLESDSRGVSGLDATLEGNGSITGIGSDVVDGSSIGVNLEGIEVLENGRLTGTGGNAVGSFGESYGVNAFGASVTGNGTLMGTSGVADSESYGMCNYGDNMSRGFSMDGGVVTVRSPATGIGSGIYTAHDEIAINGGRFTAQGAEGALANGMTDESAVTLGSGVTARTNTSYAGPGVTDYVSGTPLADDIRYFRSPADGAGNTDSGSADADVPKTGDGTPIALLVGLAAICGAWLAMRRRKA